MCVGSKIRPVVERHPVELGPAQASSGDSFRIFYGAPGAPSRCDPFLRYSVPTGRTRLGVPVPRRPFFFGPDVDRHPVERGPPSEASPGQAKKNRSG